MILKPNPPDIQDLYLESLYRIGIDPKVHDIRFVEDDWENPTVGAWGLGWEVWCDGMEVSQFTYFQQVGGLDVRPVSGELTYGLERLAMYVFGVDRVYDLPFNDPQSPYPLKYGDVFLENEKQQSAYNFEYADTEILQRWFSDCETVCKKLLVSRKAAAAARLRTGAQGQPHLQPAGRARRHLAHRTPELHRPRPRPRKRQRRSVGTEPALAERFRRDGRRRPRRGGDPRSADREFRDGGVVGGTSGSGAPGGGGGGGEGVMSHQRPRVCEDSC